MSSTYSPDLRIELIGTGDQAGVWGTTTNNNLGTFIENAVAGYTSVSIIASTQALTANDGAADEARFAAIALTTTTGANFTVCIPPNSKLYTFYNASSYVATISNSTANNGTTLSGGTTVAIPAGKTMTVWSDGTNVAQQNTHLISTTLASPTMTTPTLGTPASGTLTNCTGLPVSTGVSGLGTGVATALAVNVGSAGAPVVNGGALGTPSSGTLTNATGLPIVGGTTGTLSVARGGTGVTTSTGTGSVVLDTSPTLVTPALGTPSSATLTNATGLPISTGVSGLGSGVATFLATPSSANLRSAVTDETGSGALVFATSPTLVTPALGTPSSGSLTNCDSLPIVAGTTGTLSVARGGTGATSITSGALVKAAGTGAFSAASAADIVGQIGSTAVANATTAANGGVTSVNSRTGAVVVPVAATSQATTSGAYVDFTSIPAGVKRFSVIFNGMSTDGATYPPRIQLGSGGIQTTGYYGDVILNSSSNTTSSPSTVGFPINATSSASYLYRGAVWFFLESGNTWVASGVVSSGGGQIANIAGNVTLSGAIDTVRVLAGPTTEVFDAGSVNIQYD